LVAHELVEGKVGIAIGEGRHQHQVPKPREDVDIAARRLAADHIDDAIDSSAAGQVMDAGENVLGVVSDGGAGAEPERVLSLLGSRDERDRIGPENLADLDGCPADAA